MTNKYLVDYFDLYNIKTKEGSEFGIKIDSVPNTKIKGLIKDDTKIVFKSEIKKRILEKILNAEISKAHKERDLVFSQEDEIYVAQFTGPDIQENAENLPAENDVFFLKISFKIIK